MGSLTAELPSFSRSMAISWLGVLPFNPSQLPQSLEKSCSQRGDLGMLAACAENAYRVLSPALLCARRERPYRRATKRGYQFPTSNDHWHTPLHPKAAQ